jgi:hypothetical protein
MLPELSHRGSRFSLRASLAFILFAASLSAVTLFGQSSAPSQSGEQASSPSATAQETPALPRGKKLILTDGTFQLIREYKRDGDTVRYYSTERSGWEEIPAELVDWPATYKADAQEALRNEELDQKLKAADLAARTADIDVDTSFEARAGIILPDEVGIYVVTGSEAVTLGQNLAEARLNKMRAFGKIISGVPLISDQHSIELAGKRARPRVRSGDVEFFFRTEDRREPRMMLVKADVQGDKRKLQTMTTNMAEVRTYKGEEFPLTAWAAARGLYRFTLDQTLPAGEYALIEQNTKGEVQLYVWDFGVDLPAAVKTSK